MRHELVAQIVAMFPNEVSVVRLGGRWRSRLRLLNGSIVSVLVARSIQRCKETVRWRVDPVWHELKYVTLLARLTEDNRSFFDFHVFPNMDRRRRFDIRLGDAWLNRGERLSKLSRFCDLLTQLNAAKKDDRCS
jgi:hypothetical protein